MIVVYVMGLRLYCGAPSPLRIRIPANGCFGRRTAKVAGGKAELGGLIIIQVDFVDKGNDILWEEGMLGDGKGATGDHALCVGSGVGG